MTALLFFGGFVGYSAFCWWVIFWDGAEVLAGCKGNLLFDWFAATITADELRIGTVISWIAALIIWLFAYFSG
jgi:hypothetical protein